MMLENALRCTVAPIPARCTPHGRWSKFSGQCRFDKGLLPGMQGYERLIPTELFQSAVQNKIKTSSRHKMMPVLHQCTLTPWSKLWLFEGTLECKPFQSTAVFPPGTDHKIIKLELQKGNIFPYSRHENGLRNFSRINDHNARSWSSTVNQIIVPQ